jgi:hypothetical protein
MDGWIKYLSACVPALHDLGPHEDAIGQRCDFILVLLFSAVPGAHRTQQGGLAPQVEMEKRNI